MTQLFFSEFQAEADPLATAGSRPLVIVGAGGLGREIAVLVTQLNEAGSNWDLLGFYDDHTPATPTVAGLPYLGTVADLNTSPTPLAVAIAVGNSAKRAAIVGRLTSAKLSFPALVHPQVALRVHQRISLGAGCLIQRGCLLTCDIKLGHFVLLNLGCTVGHDAVLEDFCSLMPHANVGGGAHLETGVYLGTNATLLQQIRVGARTTVGAGAVVVRHLPANCTAVGVPAKPIGNYEL